MMKKAERSRGVSTWGSLHRDILAKIFNKLDILDITIGASRVCKSWFLASHNKTLWKTIDLTMIKHTNLSKFKNKVLPIVFHNHKHRLYNDSHVLCRQCVINLLTEVTKLSRMEPTSLSFRLNDYDYTQEDDLLFLAERMPNIEKLMLSVCSFELDTKAPWGVFSLWKNLKTLILVQEISIISRVKFRTVGEKCSNLIKFKYNGFLDDDGAQKIVHYLPSIERLSLKGSTVTTTGLVSLITRLQNLKILNLTHCRDVFSYPATNFRDYFEQVAAPQKPEKVITCSQDCRICRDLKQLC